MKKMLCSLALLILVGVSLHAQNLVRDIEPGTGGSNPRNFANLGNTLFFTADSNFTNFGYTSDGTLSGTNKLLDVNGFELKNPHGFIFVGGDIYFVANHPVSGWDLWKSDGTAEGTVEIDGAGPSTFYRSINFGGSLFYVKSGLWKSDGTTSGTAQVKDICSGCIENVQNLTDVNGTLFFSAWSSIDNLELWKTDGTSAGTVLVKDINPGIDGSSPQGLINFKGTLFFAADDGVNGLELWKSDGTSAGTVMVKDINPGGDATGVGGFDFTQVGNTLFFLADDDGTGERLWKTDGTTAGTVVVDSTIYRVIIDPNTMHSNGSALYFYGNLTFTGTGLFKSDGTSSGTVLVKEFVDGPDDLVNIGCKTFFTADDGISGKEVWETDGTTVGTVLVADINSGAGPSIVPFSSAIKNLYAIGNTLYISAFDSTAGLELWKYNVTGASSCPYVWEDPNNSTWMTAENWDINSTPIDNSDVLIKSGMPYYPNLFADVELDDLEVESGASLTVKSGYSLTVNGALVNNGTITIESDAALVQGGSSTLLGSGNFIVKRETYADRTFIGSPINNHSVGGFGVTASGPNGGQIVPNFLNPCNPDSVDTSSPEGNIMEMREDANHIDSCAQSLWHIKSSGNLENGRGYLIIPADSITLEFSGTVNNGTVTYSGLTRQSGNINTQDGSNATRGWHLVSNPYPSPIEIPGWYLNSLGFDNQIHRWDPINESWISNDPLTTATIAVGQGFQIRKTSVGGTSDFELINFFRVSGNPTFYKQSNLRNAYLNINLNGNGHEDQSMIYFYDGATENFDPSYDANKLMGNYRNPMLYTEVDGERLSYNAYAPLSFGEQRTVPLSLHAGTDTSFTLSFEGISSINDQNITVTLEDLKLDSSMTLIEGYNYSFDATNSEANERFLLHFNKAEEEINNIAQIDVNGIALYPNPTEGNITLQLNKDHSYNTAVVYDITGKEKARLVISQQTNSYGIQTASLSNGVYFLRLTGAESNTTLKFIKQ